MNTQRVKKFTKTKIGWCSHVWNPVTGCNNVSPACDNCYADTMSKRLQAIGAPKYKDGFAVRMHPDELKRTAAKGSKGFKIFVCSMSDLFHHKVTDQFIEQVFDVIRAHPDHVFQLLTKRPERLVNDGIKPPDNAWMGVTAENQKWANKRIPLLLQIPAKVRFLSVEPILGEIDFGSIPYRGDTDYFLNPLLARYSTMPNVGDGGRPFLFGLAGLGRIDWVIVGHESGPKSVIRNCGLHPVRLLAHQTRYARCALYVKQLNLDGKLTKKINEFPADLRTREFPEVI